MYNIKTLKKKILEDADMVKAELSYNPYLLETNIKFNGQEPHINSLVEKYHKEILQDWIGKVPSIFYDEMNGYDFELEFSGTKLEYEDLRKAFNEAGVTNDMVCLFHKNELDGRKAKTNKIDELLQWFRVNSNRKFDFNAFMNSNEELFNSNYVCILLNGRVSISELFGEYKVSMENIESVNELVNTDLFHTPILIQIDEQTLPELKNNLRYFFNRKDVCQNQLFFMICSPLNVTSLERTIYDLGIDRPQIITSIEDLKVKHYLETYPVSDYINETIKLLRREEENISHVLNLENEERMISNRGIHMQIDELEEIIKRLKEAFELFSNRDNLGSVFEMRIAKTHLLNSIQNWKSKKIKITRESEAIYFTKDFEQQVKKFYIEFCEKIESIFQNVKNQIEDDYRSWYQKAEYEVDFIPNISTIRNVEHKMLSEFSYELLRLKEERYVMPKDDLFGMFFKTSNDKEVVPVLETTFYCQKWRDYILEFIEPIVNELIRENEVILNTYATELAKLYRVQLRVLISEQTELKDNISAQLSDEELKLQLDNDWLVEFQDQLRMIERG